MIITKNPETGERETYVGDTERAITLLHYGQPLPVDLVTKLLDQGVDVEALERRFAV